MDNDTVTRFLAAVTAGTGVPADLYAPGAVLDATVPMWRFEQRGPERIAAQLSRWYDHPGTLTEVVRTPTPDGETVRFTFEWVEPNGPWIARQSHFLTIDGGRITRQEAWCGGRWDAAQQAEIQADLDLARAAP
jgi:hypothetical protein